MSTDEGTPELDHGARRLQGAMLDHPNLAVERMPGLSFALNRFIVEAPVADAFAASGGPNAAVLTRSLTLIRLPP